MTAPERFADRQIPLAPRAPSIHDPQRQPKPRFDPTINDGHILTAVSVIVAGAGAYWE